MLDGTTDNVAGSAGASSGTATTGNVTSGTASEAMIKAAMASSSEASTPAAKPNAGDTSTAASAEGTTGATAGATAQPQATGQAAATATRGEAPEARIQAAVRNARAEVEQQYAWAKDLKPEQATLGVELLRDIRANPAAFVRQMAMELGLTIAGDERAATAKTEPWQFPEPKLRTQDGSEVAYSAAQLKDIIEKVKEQTVAEVEGRMRPVLDFVGSEQRTRAEQDVRNQARSTVREHLTHLREMPHFKENESKVAAKIAGMDPQTKARLGTIACLNIAYNQVLRDEVFPSIQSQAEVRVREENARKAAASTGTAHPSNQGGGGKAPALKNVDDLAAHMARMAASASA